MADLDEEAWISGGILLSIRMLSSLVKSCSNVSSDATTGPGTNSKEAERMAGASRDWTDEIIGCGVCVVGSFLVAGWRIRKGIFGADQA